MNSDSSFNLLNFINGNFVKPIDGHYVESVNPATGTPLYKLPDSRSSDVESAITAAKNALKGWSNSTIAERSKILFKIADLIEEDLNRFAEAESKDQGKTLKQAMMVEIPRAIQNFRYFAGAASHLSDHSSSMKECQSFTIRSPIGVVGLISPWNLPLYLLTWKIAPAIVSNC
jgi:aminomuconate-semialdehyde/2-hydroxymuconate-6-semialdehyde dehydrogenase